MRSSGTVTEQDGELIEVDRTQGIAEFVGQCRQELVLRAALALGTLAAAVGLEKLAEIRHDQIQSMTAGRRRSGAKSDCGSSASQELSNVGQVGEYRPKLISMRFV